MELNELRKLAGLPLNEGFMKDESEIIAWLNKMKINNYKITNSVVEVHGDVDLSYKDLSSIPVQFGLVRGDFKINNNKLTSLKGSPSEVKDNFDIQRNKLTSLADAPKKVGLNVKVAGNLFKSEPDQSSIKIGGKFSNKK